MSFKLKLDKEYQVFVLVLILGIMHFLTSTYSSRPTLSKFFLDTLMLCILLK